MATGTVNRARIWEYLEVQAWKQAVAYGAPFTMQIVVLCSGELASAAGEMGAVQARLEDEAYCRAYQAGGCLTSQEVLAMLADFVQIG